MKKIIVSLLLVTVLIIPSSVSASQLSSQQISAILSLLQAFGADQSVIDNVQKSLSTQSTSLSVTITPTPVTVQHLITITNLTDSFYYAPNSTYVSFNSSGISRVKIEACVNKTSCTTLASSVSVTSSNTNWLWNISTDQPFAGAFGEKQVWLKVTDLDSGTSAFAPSYIYIIGQATSTSSPTSNRLDKNALFGAVLKAFNFLNQ